MTFDFSSPTRIVFGTGSLRQAGNVVREHGRNVLVVTGRHPDRAASLLRNLSAAQIATEVCTIPGEPTLADIMRGVEIATQAGCGCVVGFGGGSVLDAAKAIAAMTANAGDLLDYLEVIGKGHPLQQPPLPFIAIPTTAGTGSEVTRNAVLNSPEHMVKVSLRSPWMFAKTAIIDPELTVSIPPKVTAATGMDALTQCIEAYVSCKANPLTDAFCVEGIRRVARSLRTAFDEGDCLNARGDMALASLYSGFALANAGLGAVHGFAGPIGGMFDAPHGSVCAALLPHVLQSNMTAMQSRQPESPTLKRLDKIAQWLTGDNSARAEAGIEWVMELKGYLGIPQLSEWGIQKTDIPDIVRKAAVASSMKGNPLPLLEPELRRIIEAAL